MDRIFEMLLGDENDGVFAVSLVDAPAIKEDFVFLSKEKNTKIKPVLKLRSSSSDKRLVSGAILIPDQKILRMDFEGEYYIYFSAETIEKISQNYLINHNQSNVTIQHEKPVNKVHMVESWIVGKNDKSQDLGFDLPVGTWFATFKVNDDELWTDFIKTGELKGFSIEGKFDPIAKTTEAEKSLEMTAFDLWKVLKCIEKESVKKKIQTELADDDSMMWRANYSKENCPSCKTFNGQIHSLKEWASIAIPRTQNGSYNSDYKIKMGHGKHSPYNTLCEENCRCKLIKVSNSMATKKRLVTKDDKIIFYTKLAVGAILWLSLSSGSLTKAPKGVYETDDKKITVGKDGEITKITK